MLETDLVAPEAAGGELGGIERGRFWCRATVSYLTIELPGCRGRVFLEGSGIVSVTKAPQVDDSLWREVAQLSPESGDVPPHQSGVVLGIFPRMAQYLP